MEKIFHPNHPDLLRLFLTFLHPGQAAEVGKFFEHFMLQNMTTFRDKLNTFFAKQPGQIRKIYACLNELAKIENVSMETVKESILPLLKGNALLIAWFLQIFPSEKPLDDGEAADVETFFMRKNEPHTSSDVYEEFVFAENSEPTPCGLKYLGTIVYSGLPARLSFLAYDALQTSSGEAATCSHAVRELTAAEPKAAENELKVVDKNVLRAHAIRLNSVVHARQGESYADVAHLLTSPSTVAERFFATTDDVKSPKKSQKGLSLSAKKVLSPNKSKVLPKSPCIPRKALQGPILKAKKLKALVEVKSEDQDIPPTLPEAPPQEEIKTEPADEVKTELAVCDAAVCTWTRDEDRIILEEQRKDFENVAQLVDRLKEKLPNRSVVEIEKRYEFLIDILRKIQGGNWLFYCWVLINVFEV